MVIEYEKEYLEELYNDGQCRNKKYRFQKPVVSKYKSASIRCWQQPVLKTC